MKALDRYLISTNLKSSILVLMGLVILFAFFQFLEELKEIDNKTYTTAIALKYIALLIPSFFNLLFILGIMIGLVFGLGQLNSNKELQIFHIGSISKKDIIIKSIKFSFFSSVILMIILESISPVTSKLANQIKEQAKGNPIMNQTGKVWLKKDDKFIYLKEKDSNSLRLFDIENKTILNSILYDTDIDFSGNFLKLNSPGIIKILRSGENYSISNKNIESAYQIELNSNQTEFLNKNVKEMSIFEMILFLRNAIKDDVNYQEEYSELISRIIKPFTLIGMILIAIPFVLNAQRNTSIGNRIFIAISIGVFTHLITKISSAIVSIQGSISFVMPFVPTLVLLVVALIVFRLKKEEIF